MNDNPQAQPVSVVVPTYGRDQVLIDTLRRILALDKGPAEFLVVDQTKQHSAEVEKALRDWNERGTLRWLRLECPSVTAAMNRGLLEARHPLVLFLDDDVVPSPQLVREHWAAQQRSPGALVVGQILQPWHPGATDGAPQKGQRPDFAASQAAEVPEFMGGNFSVPRQAALEMGGFDENFVGAAYRYEADFARRWRLGGGKIQFWPAASLRHLKATEGGTRALGAHNRTIRPHHAVGEYYHLLVSRGALRALPASARRLVSAAASKHHLRRPWWIPVTLIAETWGLLWALTLLVRGPRLIASRAGAPA